MRETVLLINFKDKKKLQAVRGILMTQKVLGKQISREDYAQPIGALAGIRELYKEGAVYEGPDLEKEIMIFANLPESRLDSILQGMRKKNIPSVDYKAILTPTNIGWTIPQLYEELAKEHAQFHQ